MRGQHTVDVGELYQSQRRLQPQFLAGSLGEDPKDCLRDRRPVIGNWLPASQSSEDVDAHRRSLAPIGEHLEQERHEARIAEPLEVQQCFELASH